MLQVMISLGLVEAGGQESHGQTSSVYYLTRYYIHQIGTTLYSQIIPRPKIIRKVRILSGATFGRPAP